MNIEQIRKWIKAADAILIGAGSGLSEAAGLHYNGEKFEKEFSEYIKKYKFTDLYTASFHTFETEEEKWAYWAKHINYEYYENKKSLLYRHLYKLIKDKNYFVITTNTDGLFINNLFDKDRVFEAQGSYSKLQCAKPCHKTLYDNEKIIKEMLQNIDKKLRIPSDMVPKCPKCKGSMSINIRHNDTFVEDANWKKQYRKYNSFVKKYSNKRLLLLEFGVGFDNPSVIRFPFDQMIYENESVRLVRFNKKYLDIPEELGRRAIGIDEDIDKVINSLLKKK